MIRLFQTVFLVVTGQYAKQREAERASLARLAADEADRNRLAAEAEAARRHADWVQRHKQGEGEKRIAEAKAAAARAEQAVAAQAAAILAQQQAVAERNARRAAYEEMIDRNEHREPEDRPKAEPIDSEDKNRPQRPTFYGDRGPYRRH